MLGFGPIGWIAGSALMIIGIGATMFGVNEVVSGIAGANPIRDWMGDGLYDGLYLGLNIGSAIGSFVGNIYMSSSAGRLAHEIQQNAKHWDNGTFITRYGSLKYHYRNHVVKAGFNMSPTQYTNSARNVYSTFNDLKRIVGGNYLIKTDIGVGKFSMLGKIIYYAVR